MYKQALHSFGRIVLTATLACASAAGCGTSDAVYPVALATAKSQQALSMGSVYEMNGSYGAACTGRQGPWSLALAQLSSLTNPPLSVEQDNASCVLQLESIRIGESEDIAVTYTASQPIALGGSYAAKPSAFSVNGSEAVAFYANAAILPDATFHANFVIQFVYSDDPAAASVSKNAEPSVTLGGAASVQGVSTPDYTTSLANLHLRTNLQNVVTEVSGSVDLSGATQTGESYAILPMALEANPPYDMVDRAFQSAVPRTMNGASHSIAWDEFGFLGVSLATPAVRTLVITHTFAGVNAYQIITISIGE